MSLRSLPEFDLSQGGQTVFRKHEILSVLHKVVRASSEWDLGLGYFSFSGFRLLAWPLAHFLLNGGRIRVYCNQVLSESDYNAINDGAGFGGDVDFVIDLKKMFHALQSSEGDLFSDCIGYLVSTGKLDVRVLVSRESGLGVSHQKNLIFRDNSGEVVVLTGSANMSVTALNFNNESMTAHCSFWNERATNVTIRDHVADFNTYYLSEDPDWKILKFGSDALKNLMATIGFRSVEKEDLEGTLRNFGRNGLRDLPNDIRRDIEDELLELDPWFVREPSFPYPAPHDYQVDAYKAWCDAGYKGLFAMATGTGKTLTAINCLLEEYQRAPKRYIFVVPGKELVWQWQQELERCNFGKVHRWFSEDSDATMREVRRQLDRLNAVPDTPITLVITYDGFCSSGFKNIFGYKLDSFTIVFDEVHDLGAPGKIRGLPDVSQCRLIGLSATPERQYDEIGGNDFISSIFQCRDQKYTYEFSLKRAIKEKCLVPYDYELGFAFLNDEEWEEYCEFTRRLWKTDESGRRVINAMVAIQRSSVVQKANDKLRVTKEMVAKLVAMDRHRYTLLFCPEGFRNGLEESELKVREIDFYLRELCEDFPMVKFDKIDSSTGQRRDVLETFAEGEHIHQLLSMKMLDQGVDVPAIRNAILIASAAAHREHIQRRGRVLRTNPGKYSATLFDIICLPPFSVLSKEVGMGLVRLEFRRLKEFAELSQNTSGVMKDFDHFFEEIGCEITFKRLAEEIETHRYE